MSLCITQHQYAFIHDAVLEWLICGDTKIPAREMKRAMERLSQVKEQTGQNGYDTQFQVNTRQQCALCVSTVCHWMIILL